MSEKLALEVGWKIRNELMETRERFTQREFRNRMREALPNVPRELVDRIARRIDDQQTRKR